MTETGDVSLDPEAARTGFIDDMQFGVWVFGLQLTKQSGECDFRTRDFAVINWCFPSSILDIGDVVELLMCV